MSNLLADTADGSAPAGVSGGGSGGAIDSAESVAAQLTSLVAEIQEAYNLFLTERDLFPAADKADAELLDALGYLNGAASFAGNGLLPATRDELRKAIDCLERAEVFMRYGDVQNFIDATEFFVRQHYVDFLGREPDEAGLAFWTGEIDSCGSDDRCQAVKRDNVSAAFFLSVEFQQTGFLVYRAYAAAFGPARVGGAAPLTLREFLPDTQQAGRGVVVNAPGWEYQLENNRRAFFDDFARRPQFLAAYPAAMSAAAFVDALNSNAGGSLSPGERDALVGELSGGARTRAEVLRAVAENADFDERERHRAFVLAQYFGYLGRDPDAAPNTDFSGYQFWLQKLNNHGGDFQRAEMVRSFLVSQEYRGRFSPR